MILADTSAWVEYDRATESAVDQRLTELIATGGPLAVTEPVAMQVLAGMIDCMIASVAWRCGAALLAHDADLDRVARVIGIELDEASLRA